MIVLKREIRHIETLHFLISHKMTGTPDQLAEKLSISRRQLFNIIAFFRHLVDSSTKCEFTQSFC